MNKALIVYGTRYGAAASTSEEVAKTLRQEGIETRVVDARKEKAKDVADYDLVIVGSGIQMHRWTGEPEDFLKKHQKELVSKKLALFVCCGSATDKEKPELAVKARRRYLEEKAAKYHLQPVALGLFGGIYNYNKMPWFAKKAMNADRPGVEAAYKETEPGIYDTRDLDAIRAWAEELARTVKSSSEGDSA
jgi:menaquinone-dependent protoporphyrinogen oxidase